MSILDKITGKEAEKKTKAPAKEAKAEVKEAVKAPVAKAVKPAAEKKSIASEKQGVYGVLVSPLISEKSASEEKIGKYTFAVTIGATKSEIIKAVETRYGITPIKVNVSNLQGKVKRTGKYWGQQKDTRKAIITLPKGKSINVYESK